MNFNDNPAYCSRPTKQAHYDQRLILKVVKEVENGLPRKEAIRIYHLGNGTIGPWMKKFGSSHYHSTLKRKKYTALQKRTIVSAIQQGRMSIQEAQVAHNIKTKRIIRGWLQQFAVEKVEICGQNNQPVSKKKNAASKNQPADLQKALQEAELKIKALNTLIDVAEEQLKINIRKKSGAKQSQK